MKQFKTYTFIVLLAVLIIPSVAFASWWNPISWHIWDIFNIFSKPQTSIVQQNKNPNQNQVQNAKTQTAADQTANWQTYIDNQLGISIKYPTALGTPQKNINGASYWQTSSLYLLIGPPAPTISTLTANDIMSEDNILKNNLGNKFDYYNLEKISVGGEDAVKTSFKEKNQNKYYITVEVPYKNDKITIDYIYSDQKDESQFNEMISTFKFLSNSTTDVNSNSTIVGKNGSTQTVSPIVYQETFQTGTNWTGKNSQIILINSSTAAARITGAPNSDGYLYRTMTIPANAQYMTYDVQNEKATRQSFLTLNSDKEVLDYYPLAKIDNKMVTSNQVFIGDYAGKTTTILFTVNQVGDELPSVLITNITFYK